MPALADHPLTSAKIGVAIGLCGITGLGLAVMTLPAPAVGLQFWLGLIIAFLGPLGGLWLYWNILFKKSLVTLVAWVFIIAGFCAVITIGYKTWHFSDEDNNFAYVDFPPDGLINIQRNSAWIKNSGSRAIQNVEIGIQRLTDPTFVKKFAYPLIYQDGTPVTEIAGPITVRVGLDTGEYNIAIRDINHAYLEHLTVELSGGVYTRKIYVWPHVRGDETAAAIYPIFKLGYK